MNPIYLAGLIDGEGYFGLIPHTKRGSVNTSYQCVMKLALAGKNAKEVTTVIANQYNGHLYKRRTNTATGKEVYTVDIKSKPRMKILMQDIQPHIIVKKEQAALIAEFIELPMLHPKHHSFDKNLFDRREQIAKELKSLTQRISLATTE